MALKHAPIFATAFTLALAASVLTLGSSAAASVSCDRVAATTGSDSAAGTDADPYRTAGKLVGSLAPGQTGCFRAGTYSWNGDLSIRTASVTVASYPGERATLQGRLRVEITATGAVVEGLVLNGRNSNDYVSPMIYADRVVLRGNEITNERASSPCIIITTFYDAPPPEGVVIEGNRVHDCGHAGTNQQHGMYIGTARDTVIRNNWIYDNADRGIQVYPRASGTLITGNVIDSNGEGIIFGGTNSEASHDNLVEGNIITNSTIRHNVEASWGGPTGSGNVVRNNCVWTTRSSYSGSPDGSGIGDQVGFVAHHNLAADPQYVDRAAGDYRLKTGSPCAGVLSGEVPDGDPPQPRPDGMRFRANRRSVSPGQGLGLRGRVPGPTSAGEQTVIAFHRKAGWKRLATAQIESDNRFALHVTVPHTSRKRISVRAQVGDLGRSRVIRVRVRG